MYLSKAILSKAIGGVTVGGLALTMGLVVPAGASTARPNVPFASSVSTALVTPSTLVNNGGYDVTLSEVGASPDNAGFFLYRYTEYTGSWQYLGSYSGTQTTDLVEGEYFGDVQYEMIPYDHNGNEGSGVYSNEFYANVVDNPFTVVTGNAKYIYSSHYFSGSELQTTTGIGTRVRWYTDYNYNQGVVVGTGPKGGTGTVYVNGVKKGTISFYSKTNGYSKVLFRYGTSNGASNTIDIVATAKGKGGGTNMNLDAGIENED
jgi:hypothetical protein